MTNYTEKDLKSLKKADLIAICVENMISYDDHDSKDALIEKIVGPKEAPKEHSNPDYNAILEARRGVKEYSAYEVELARRRGQKLKTVSGHAALQLELARRRRKFSNK